MTMFKRYNLSKCSRETLEIIVNSSLQQITIDKEGWYAWNDLQKECGDSLYDCTCHINPKPESERNIPKLSCPFKH